MTDKEIKDYCKYCSVEPPAMKFKCPECKHNPDNENNLAKDINVPHKEQIIVDGVEYNPCDGCELYDGNICTGGFTYGVNGVANRLTHNKHLANQFHKVYQQLYLKTQECRALKRKVKLMMDCPDCKVDEYKKALEEIEGYVKTTIRMPLERKLILDIINKADFGKSERSETRLGESCVEPVEPPIIKEAKGEGNE